MGVLKNGKHELFAEALAKGETATRAYVSAGYKNDRHHAARMATKGHIIERVRELKEGVAERVIVSQAEVIEELGKIAFARIDRALSWGRNGMRLRDSAELDDATLAAIAEVRQGSNGKLAVKFRDKVAALTSIAKILGWFDKVEDSGTVKLVVTKTEAVRSESDP